MSGSIPFGDARAGGFIIGRFSPESVLSKRLLFCFGTTDGHLTMDGRQAFGAKSEQFRISVICIIFFIDDSYRNNARQR